FRDYFAARQQATTTDAKNVIRCGSRRPTIPPYEWGNPVEAPQCEGGKKSFPCRNPVFINERKKPTHQIRHPFKIRRNMTADVNRLFSKAATKLSNVSDCYVIESPQGILV